MGWERLGKAWIFSSWTQSFRILPRLNQSFPCSRHSVNWYHGEWCTTYQDSTFYVTIFIVSGKREGEERGKKLSSLDYNFLFLQVGCTAMLFNTGFCSAWRIWGELYKNLIFLSSLEHIEPDSMEKIPFLDEFGYLIGAN